MSDLHSATRDQLRAFVERVERLEEEKARNCLSNWYMDAAQEKGIELSKDDSREIVYGMTYAEWKEKHQTETSADKLARFEEVRPQESRD